MKKSILITGSTDGIGKIAAIEMAKKGHEIAIHGRSQDKVDALIHEIKSSTNNESIRGYVADFSDLAAVKNMAEKINQDYAHLDVLINNAGVFKSPVAKNEQGFDLRIVVNYLSPYLLTNALVDILKKSKQPRVINLSSKAQSRISNDALLANKDMDEYQAYAQSKLALTMWNTHFAKQHKDITSIAVNPGSLLNTRMAKEGFGETWSPADKGSNILQGLALADEYNNDSGKYFDNDLGDDKGRFGQANADAYDEIKIESLINDTEKALNQAS